MKNSYLLPLSLLLLLLSSCQKEKVIREVTIDESFFKTVIIDPDEFSKDGRTKLSEIAESISFIPLQTSDDALIGNIEKMLIWKNRFYIWDRLTETIFCFDSEGKIVHKIKKQGQGPGEYPRI